jgi:uncharacterized protein YjbI with pentapeptide repeats
MANPELLKILKEGVAFWNKWRAENPRTFLDLVGADLRGANLAGANLNGVKLAGADLTSANLAGALLIATNLCATDLRWADLTGSELGGADLTGAYVFNANLSQSTVGFTVFGNNDLSTVKGIDAVRHLGPSTIGVDTIYKSRGNIPEVFLRGAGVPDDFITQMKSLVTKPQAFYSCFISYTSPDDEFAQRLYADLQRQGVRCWLAPKDTKAGAKFRMRIDESIRIHDKLMVILSANSLRRPWLEEEIEAALEKERNQKNSVLVSIRLDEAVMESDQTWAASLRRTRLIADFHAWKDNEGYQSSFNELLLSLKA